MLLAQRATRLDAQFVRKKCPLELSELRDRLKFLKEFCPSTLDRKWNPLYHAELEDIKKLLKSHSSEHARILLAMAELMNR